MKNQSWMIYGANGYTGELIARQAVRNGVNPILAGRNKERIQHLANELGLDYRVFSLEDPFELVKNLSGISLVLHCAGPFSVTSSPMIEACLEVGSHYLDITGEINVFEHTHAKQLSDRAKGRGIILCSGVGFDVIPTDCVALKLKELLPEATQLSLGFDSDSGISPGTFKTMIRGLSSGSAERKAGNIISFPMGKKRRSIDFGRGDKSATAIPWGDVSTAFYTTQIPAITTWIPMSAARITSVRLFSLAGPLFGTQIVQNGLLKWVDRSISGPDQKSREQAPAFIWGEAQTEDGKRKTVRIQTANVYDVTVYGALAVVERIFESSTLPSGSYTPASLFGSALIEELPGSGSFIVS